MTDGFGRPRPDDLYAVLGVPQDATSEEIDRAFTRLAEDYLLTDPSSGDRKERMRSLEYAYQVLSDPTRRSLYDRDRAARDLSPPADALAVSAGSAEAEAPVAPESPAALDPPAGTEPPLVTEPPPAEDSTAVTEPPPATDPPAVAEPPTVTVPPAATAPPGAFPAGAAAPAAAAAAADTAARRRARRSLNPIDRMTANLPRPWRIAIDWAVTIIGAVLIVLALKQWVVNPYRIPSSSMEPTLHCARPGQGCEAHFSDRVLACRICYLFSSPERGQIIVFNTPPHACGVGGTFVKRLIGLPGETVTEKNGFVSIDGKPLKEPYIKPDRRDNRSGTWHVPTGHYFFMGDNRVESCDSREWGSVPRSNIIGEVFFVYWPPNRIGFR